MTQLPEGLDRAAVAARSLEQLFELVTTIGDYLEHGLADRRLTRARAEVVWRLRQTGPVTQRRLSDLLGVTPRNVTGLLDALAAQGLVQRLPHPSDRRAVLVSLTETGAATATALVDGHRQFAARLFEKVDAADLAVFAGTLDHVLSTLRMSDPAGACPAAE